MADQAPNNSAEPGKTDPSAGPGDAGKVTEPAVDLAKIPADQLSKVLENPELWNQPRIKELREKAALADKLEADQKKSVEASLEKNKEFEALANKRQEENVTLQKQIQDGKIQTALLIGLSKETVVDMDAALKLVDLSQVKVSDAGSVEGVTEAIDSLKKGKEYLFKAGGSGNIGAASNGAGGDGSGVPMKFKRSQLRDNTFYKAHEKDILDAAQKGLIEDDLTPGGTMGPKT
jgi:hypothetical protein